MLYVHRSERADQLIEILGDVLAEPLADPMTAEIVAVPTRGVERWLTQRLSHRLGTGAGRGDGVCANVAFPFPGTLINATTAAATGMPADADPWLPERSVWPLLDLIDAHLDEPFLQAAGAPICGRPHRPGRLAPAVPQRCRPMRRPGVRPYRSAVSPRCGIWRTSTTTTACTGRR